MSVNSVHLVAEKIGNERKQMLIAINHYPSQSFEEIVIVDLDTTSATSVIFIVGPNDKMHTKMIKRLHLPVIPNLVDDLNGTLLARYKNGPIHCTEDCFMLKPLNLEQDSDGFFLVK